MKDDLERRIQEALDAGTSIEEAGLGAELEADSEASQTAAELAKVDAWVRGWGDTLDLEDGADALARRIEQRLDEDLAPVEHDPTLPPVFDDDDSWRRIDDESDVGRSGEFELGALTDQMQPEAAAEAAASRGSFAPPPPAVVDLSARREDEPRAGRSGWWIAVAAVVGLAATGTFLAMQQDAEPMVASSAARQGPAELAAEMEMAEEMAPEPAAPAAAPTIQAVPAETATAAADEASAPGGAGAALGNPYEPVSEAEPAEQDLAVATPTRRRLRRARTQPTTIERAASEVAPPPTMARASMASTMSAPRALRGGVGSTGAPSRDDVRRVQTRTQGAVRACVGTEGPATLAVMAIVEGATGRVTDVRVPGVTSSQTECVRSALRRERFPEREGVQRFHVGLRYRLRD